MTSGVQVDDLSMGHQGKAAFRWRAVGRGLAALTLPLLVASCSSATPSVVVSGSTLAADGVLAFHRKGSGAETVHETADNTTWTTGAMLLCLDSGQAATIDRVTLSQTEGPMTLKGFAVRDPGKSMLIGTTQSTLTSLHLKTSDRVVTAPCSGETRQELVIEVRRGADAAEFDGVDVAYSGGTIHYDFQLTLCENGAQLEQCSRVPETSVSTSPATAES